MTLAPFVEKGIFSLMALQYCLCQTYMYKYIALHPNLCVYNILFLLRKYLGVELLGQVYIELYEKLTNTFSSRLYIVHYC